MNDSHHRRASRAAIALVALAVLVVGACGSSTAASKKTPAATLEKVATGQIGRITLTEQAAKRLDIKTTAVEAGIGTTPLKVPFDSVIYQPDGTTWVYTNLEGLVFKRESIKIDRIETQAAWLTAGPPAGTKIVTVGASELWGFEFGVGK